MTSDTVQPCRIEFLNRWSVESHLWGTSAGALGLELDKKLFACCNGDGLRVESVAEKTARLCGLSRRWNLLVNISRQLSTAPEKTSEFWSLVSLKQSVERQAPQEIGKIIAERLDEWLNAGKGRIFSLPREGDSGRNVSTNLPAIIGSILSWHFERVVLIAKAGESQLPVNLWQDLLTRHSTARAIMLVEAAPDLWNASKLEPLEAAIAFAYERRIPIWIYYSAGQNLSAQSHEAKDPQRKSRSFRQAVSSRLEGLRQKSPEAWLSSQALSRLSEICVTKGVESDRRDIPEYI